MENNNGDLEESQSDGEDLSPQDTVILSDFQNGLQSKRRMIKSTRPKAKRRSDAAVCSNGTDESQTANGSSSESVQSNPPRSEMDEQCTIVKKKVLDGTYTHKKREANVRSKVWESFHEIYENKEKIQQFVLCTGCNDIIYKPTPNTNCLIRHECTIDSNVNLNLMDTNNNTDDKVYENGTTLISSSDKSKLKIAASRFIVKDLRPYNAIQGDGLLDLCYTCVDIGKKYRRATKSDLKGWMPCRNTVRAAICDLAEQTRQHISQLLKKAISTGGVAASTDNWTDDYRKLTYITVVAHLAIYEHGVLTYYRFVLSTSEVTEFIKSGQVLVEYITKIFAEYDITQDEFKLNVVFISDRGPNIKWGLIRAGFKRITCYAHLIHNLVTAMLKEPKVKLIVNKCLALSTYVHNNGLNRDLNPTLKRSTKTRWNSVMTMIDCIIKSYKDVYELLIIKQRHRNAQLILTNKQPDSEITDLITELNTSELTEIKSFLATFKEFSDQLEGDKYITLHMVWPIHHELKRIFGLSDDNDVNVQVPISDDEGSDDENDEIDDDAIADLDGSYRIIDSMKKLGHNYMKKNSLDFKPTFEHMVMTLLTPATKKMKHISFIQRIEFHQQLEDYISQHYPREEPAIESSEVQTNQSTLEKFDGPSFMNAFMSFDDSGELLPPESELERYLKHPVRKSDCDTKKWWSENSEVYPSLFRLFRKFSCVPATSAGSERTFSTTGNIITDKRSVILPSNVNDIVVVRNNL